MWISLGFGMGAFFSLMSTTFAYEDPLSRTWQTATMNTSQKTAQVFKDMGKGMWKSGRGFGTVGALYAGSECVIEGVCRSGPFFVLHFH
jgi:import inner membrane translocase subunit TIM22